MKSKKQDRTFRDVAKPTLATLPANPAPDAPDREAGAAWGPNGLMRVPADHPGNILPRPKQVGLDGSDAHEPEPPGPEWERAAYPHASDELVATLYTMRAVIRRVLATDIGLPTRKGGRR